MLFIFKEAMANVLKHASAHQVVLEIRIENGRVQITLADDGVGFDREHGRKGYGLSNYQQRARRMGGHVEVDTAPGKGTRVTFSATVPKNSKEMVYDAVNKTGSD